MCSCSHKVGHAYCVTAQVLRSQKIYCKECYSYFLLYVRSERIFSSQYLGGVVRLLLTFGLFVCLIYGVFLIDRYLKNQNYIDKAVKLMVEGGDTQININEFINKNNSENNVDNTFVIIPLAFVLIIIMIWCFYLRFVISFMKRKRLLWAEVQDYYNSEYSISRTESKMNLHMVDDITKKLKSYSSLFDKYWYLKRESQYLDGIYGEHSLQFSNDNLDENGMAESASESKQIINEANNVEQPSAPSP